MEEEKLLQEEVVEPEEEMSEEELEAIRKKTALTAFICSQIAFVVLWFPLGNIAGIILSAIALKKQGQAKEVYTQPYKIFRIVAFAFGIAGLVFSILSVLWTLLVMVVALLIAGVYVLGIIIVVVYLIFAFGLSLISTIISAAAASLMLL